MDLRNIGTGNTVTLLNGRRLVQTPGYSTEWVGGSFVPVNSVNSNTIPVYGAERVEILRDGAAAIYGADAVAGVINTVLKSDYEGATVRVRTNWYDSFEAQDQRLASNLVKILQMVQMYLFILIDMTEKELELVKIQNGPLMIFGISYPNIYLLGIAVVIVLLGEIQILDHLMLNFMLATVGIFILFTHLINNKCDGSYSKWDQPGIILLLSWL